jgi:zinc protease
MVDGVGQPRITEVWNIAPWGDPSLEHLGLLGNIFAGSKTSRLYQRLVVKEELATDCRAGVSRRELGSQFTLTVSAKPGADLAKIEAIVDEELAKLWKEGPTSDELDRVRAQQLAQFIRGVERVGGGFGAKTDTLAEGSVYAGDPGFYKKRIARIEKATVADLKNAAAASLEKNGRFILTAVPFPKYESLTESADRSRLPDTGITAEATFPKFERAKLKNGLEILFVARHAVPTVEMQLLVDCGAAADPKDLSGLASMTLNLMDEGTKTKTAVQIGEIQERLGARLGAGAGDDGASISLSALKANLDGSLDLFADVLLHPSFPKRTSSASARRRSVRMQSSKLEADAMAARVLPPLVFGEQHPYSSLGGGSGTESRSGGSRRRLLPTTGHAGSSRTTPSSVVVGDTTLAELVPLLEQKLSS